MINYDKYFKIVDDDYEKFVQQYFIFQDKETEENRKKLIYQAKRFRTELSQLLANIRDVNIGGNK